MPAELTLTRPSVCRCRPARVAWRSLRSSWCKLRVCVAWKESKATTTCTSAQWERSNRPHVCAYSKQAARQPRDVSKRRLRTSVCPLAATKQPANERTRERPQPAPPLSCVRTYLPANELRSVLLLLSSELLLSFGISQSKACVPPSFKVTEWCAPVATNTATRVHTLRRSVSACIEMRMMRMATSKAAIRRCDYRMPI